MLKTIQHSSKNDTAHVTETPGYVVNENTKTTTEGCRMHAENDIARAIKMTKHVCVLCVKSKHTLNQNVAMPGLREGDFIHPLGTLVRSL